MDQNCCPRFHPILSVFTAALLAVQVLQIDPADAQETKRHARMSYAQFKPHTNTEHGPPSGHSVDLMEVTERRAGSWAEYHLVENPADILEAIETRTTELYTARDSTLEHMQLVELSRIIGSSSLSIVLESSQRDIEKLDDANVLQIGAVHGPIGGVMLSSAGLIAILTLITLLVALTLF